MTRNPEFVRNLWLVHNPVWLVLLPLLLGGAFLGIHVLDTIGRPQSIGAHPQWEVYAFAVFGFVTILFGSGRGTLSIATEMKEHTWDGQRMSAIPPWSMAWGKLFGSSALAWYGGFVCIVLYAFMAHSQSLPDAHIIKTVIIWILAGVIAQSSSMISYLVGLSKAPTANRENGWSIATIVSSSSGYLAIPVLWILLPPSYGITWYGAWIGALDLLILTAVAYAAWALTGLYFMMRREFQYTNSPLSWLGFAVFTIVYVAGFDRGYGDPLPLLIDDLRTPGGMLPLFVGVLLFYSIALAEPVTWQTFRGIGRSFAGRAWKEVFDQMPRSVVTLALLAVVGGCLIIGGNDYYWPEFAGQRITDDVLIAALLFAARDMALILLLNSMRPSDTTSLMAFGCLLVLHGILPITAFYLADPLLPMFWPIPTGTAWLTISPVLLQVMAIYVVLGHRIRSIHREVL